MRPIEKKPPVLLRWLSRRARLRLAGMVRSGAAGIAEWIAPELVDDMQFDFSDDLRGPDPDDRFNWYAIAIILAAVACGVIAWGVI